MMHKGPFPDSTLTPSDIEAICSIFNSKMPNPQTELDYKTPYQLLVAVVLSAQTTDKQVNRVTPGLFQQANTPEQMVELGQEGIERSINSIGLFRNKAKHILALSQKLIQDHESQVPLNREALMGLAGVGRKTANVVLNVVLGEATFPVDTHVFRVSKRIGLAQGKNVDQIEQALIERIPEKWAHLAHHWLVLHGRYCCKAQKPLCAICPIQAYCRFFQDHLHV